MYVLAWQILDSKLVTHLQQTGSKWLLLLCWLSNSSIKLSTSEKVG
jgi:hypothetical protein